MLENPAHHFLTVSALQGNKKREILSVYVRECESERNERKIINSHIFFWFTGIAGGTILYVVVFEILEREKKKSVPGLLQLTFLLIGFAVMVCIEVFGEFKKKKKHIL